MNRTAAVVGMHFNRKFSALHMPPILGLGHLAPHQHSVQVVSAAPEPDRPAP